MDPTLVGKAVKMAAIAHCFDTDRAGRPYILHLLHVMGKMPTDELRIVAVLHDLMEYHPENTPDALRRLGLPEHIIEALEAITKRKGEAYDDYISRVAANGLARFVKIEDLKHNMDRRRIPGSLTELDLVERLDKYARALERLTAEAIITPIQASRRVA